jgi:hypothetical protein
MGDHILVLGAAALLLVGCGGGGGGSSTPPPPNLSSAPGEAAMNAFLQANHQGTLNATNGANTFSAQYSFKPNPGTTTFNGVTANSAVRTVTLYENGVLLANSVSTGYFELSPYVPLGQTFSSGSPYAVVTAFTELPGTLTVGGSGAFESDVYYHDSTMGVIDANETDTYSVSANNSTTLFLCIQSVISGVTASGTSDGLADDTETDCYTIDSAGNTNLATIAITVNGVTLNFH